MTRPTHSRWIKLALLCAGLFVVTGLPTREARAHIVIQGDANFVECVEMCIQKILASGGAAAANINTLVSSSHVHSIKPGTGYGSNTPHDGSKATDPTGGGTGSTTEWDKTWNKNYIGDTTKSDPCANLAHELTHAGDANGGTWDCSAGHNGIAKKEVKACGVENEYRANQNPPLDKRNKYCGKALP